MTNIITWLKGLFGGSHDGNTLAMSVVHAIGQASDVFGSEVEEAFDMSAEFRAQAEDLLAQARDAVKGAEDAKAKAVALKKALAILYDAGITL